MTVQATNRMSSNWTSDKLKLPLPEIERFQPPILLRPRLKERQIRSQRSKQHSDWTNYLEHPVNQKKLSSLYRALINFGTKNKHNGAITPSFDNFCKFASKYTEFIPTDNYKLNPVTSNVDYDDPLSYNREDLVSDLYWSIKLKCEQGINEPLFNRLNSFDFFPLLYPGLYV